MLKWFSVSGIISEVKRIRWSKPKNLAKDSGSVIFFTAAFALFFVICTLINAGFLKVLGV
ncbi:MAG: preprotein translocase subunit SecE [Clostridia bacterium]|nr:preprotein translocase subunit SecE [Erysipelotrichia bacterium]NCC87269.1 preprotein translocase subunit SecE [Clostridia bacterium]